MSERNGKIGRLPVRVQDALNIQLGAGHKSAKELVAWLNELPETRETVIRHFEGRLVTEQNMSDWRAGGYEEWKMHQEASARMQQMSERARQLDLCAEGSLPGGKAGCVSLADALATMVTVRYADLLEGWNGEVDEAFEKKLAVLQRLVRNIDVLRRGNHRAERVRREKELSEEEQIEQIREWVGRSNRVYEAIHGKDDWEKRERMLRMMMGRSNCRLQSEECGMKADPEPGGSGATSQEGNRGESCRIVPESKAEGGEQGAASNPGEIQEEQGESGQIEVDPDDDSLGARQAKLPPEEREALRRKGLLRQPRWSHAIRHPLRGCGAEGTKAQG